MAATYSIVTYDKINMEHCESDHLDDVLALANPERVNWITMSGIALNEDHSGVKRLFDYFRLNPSLFDSFFDHKEQQFEGEYDECLYLEYSILLYRPAKSAHKTVSGSIIVGTNFLLLLERTPAGIFKRTRAKILARHTRVQKYRADYLLYLLIRTIVINYQGIYKALVMKFEALEDEVIRTPGSEQAYDKILDLREEFKPFYPHLAGLNELVGEITDEETPFVGNGVKKRLNRTIAREMEALEEGQHYLRSWVGELIEIHRANVNESTNRVMKILTVISTIFLPLTFIAGVYGMNFQYMPELEWEHGYPLVMLFMAVLAVSALVFMRYKKWL